MEKPSGTVTFLFTDIEGSTRLWQADEQSMRKAVARHDEILYRAIADHDGVMFSTMGDGVAAAFASASSAVTAALVAQQLLSSEPWPTARPVQVRIGLHTGEAELRDGDYFGTAVNRTARLMAVGHGGQVLCSATTASLVEAEWPLIDLGEHRLRDLDRPIRIFQIGQGGFPPLRSLDAFPGNLPVQLTSFVGRDRELETIGEALSGVRLVTLTGTGGVGKTRMALQAAAEAVPGFPDGVWLCELAAASDVDAMLQVVAISLGFAPRQDVSLAQGIREFIGLKRLLVILDNCEHLLDGTADLAETILAGCPNAQILATSREVLDVAGERVIRLRSLAIPPAGATLEDLNIADSARLFLARAEAVGVDVTFGPTDAAAVAEICRRLDGIPLAIELAAARTVALSPGEIAAHLDERFRLLTGGRRAAVERHHTLRATVDWSYSLLSPTEQAVFERMGVFPASFDAMAAKAVASGDGIEEWDVVDAVTSLVTKSMLGAERGVDGPIRYQMLETLRHYARERLDSAGDADERRRRHARHYLEVADQIGQGLRGADDVPWRRNLGWELDNLRSAVFWGLDSTLNDDGELAVEIIARVLGGYDWGSKGVGSWAEQAVPRARQSNLAYRGVVLAAAAINAFYRGELELGWRLSQEALSEGAVEGSPIPSLVYNAAVLFARPRDLPRLLDEGLATFDRIGAGLYDKVAIRQSVTSMAAFAGATELAQTQATELLPLSRRLNNATFLALSLYVYALVFWRSQPKRAREALDEYGALASPELSGLAFARAYALSAQLRALEGDAEGALRDLRQAVINAHAHGDRPAMAATIARGAHVMHAAAALEAAAVFAGITTRGALAGLNPAAREDSADMDELIALVEVALGPEGFSDAIHRGAESTYEDIPGLVIDAIDAAAYQEAGSKDLHTI